MATTTQFDSKSPNQEERIPFLENGDCLDGEEFLRRWEAMPEVKQAELVEGVVFINAAVRFRSHGTPASAVVAWLQFYVAETPGLECGVEATVALDHSNLVQPDVCLLVSPEANGNCSLNEHGILEGSPELIVEISASSANRDLHQKKEVYEKLGVAEYIVWDVEKKEIIWFMNLPEGFLRQSPDKNGLLRSRVFPGLQLRSEDLLNRDLKALQGIVQTGVKSAEHEKFVQTLKKVSE